MEALKEFAFFLKKNHLKDLAREYVKNIHNKDLDILRFYQNVPIEEQLSIVEASLSDFLSSIIEGNYLEKQLERVHKWDSGEIKNFSRESINAYDLLYIYFNQKTVLINFLPLFTQDNSKIVQIMLLLEDYYIKAEEASLRVIFKVRDEVTERLKRSEKMLEQAQAVARVGSYEWNLKTNTVTWSKEIYSIFGVKDHQFGKTFESIRKFIHPEDYIQVMNSIEEAVAREGNYSIYHRIITPNKQIRTLFTRGEIVYENNTPVTIFGTVQDVSERLIQEKKFETLLQSAPDAIFITDSTFTILEWNELAEKLLGWTMEEIRGMELVNSFFPLQMLTELHNNRDKFDVSGKAELFNKPFNIEARRKDGTFFPAEITLSPVNIENEPLFIGFIRDITERKKAEENLLKLAAIVKSSDDGIFSITSDGVIESWNKGAENVFGYTSEEILGQNISILSPGEQTDDLLEIKRRVNEGEHISHLDIKTVKKNGQENYVSLTVSPIRNNLNEVIALSVIARDMTNKKRVENQQELLLQQLEKKNKELNDFAYVVSHDLKAPLRAIGSLSNWLLSDYGDKLGAEGNETIQLLVGRVNRMDKLIDGILQYSRIGRLKNESQEIDLNDIIKEIVFSIAPPSHIKVKIEQPMPVVYADRISMEQVFQNLIGNAINYMDKKEGLIRVGSKDEGDKFIFYVADNGPGIEEKYYEKIFQIFQSLSSRDEKEGTGIGLAIVKKIVEIYNGKVWLESRVGEGSTFFLQFPKASFQMPASATKPVLTAK